VKERLADLRCDVPKKPRARALAPDGSPAKASLLRFALDTTAAAKPSSDVDFAQGLLACFGWEGGNAPGAEIPAELSVTEQGRQTRRRVAMRWKERGVLMEVAKPDVALAPAWNELLRICLQLDPIPQYVVLTNQRELQLFDLARDKKAPRLSMPLDELPKRSEAFSFFSTQWTPGMTPEIVNSAKVSREVADLVAQLYRSLLAAHPKRPDEVIQFTLRCITTMFSEDIGLLPKAHFTALLYEGARHGDAEKRIGELFHAMSSSHMPEPRVIPHFNGGLFTDANTIPLGRDQLDALTRAAEADWKFVDPHIFGSVFQGIMGDAERHASGAHYTATDDIMLVVGPTIVEPWRKRIRDAGSLSDLLDARADLLKFRVLDPACGSGNFLYVAFRELYRLDTQLLGRIREFASGQKKVNWSAGIQTTSFFGIDNNRFAVALAKVTLNIAKKIAFDERRAMALELSGQVVMDVDPSLPLDNLDKNIRCDDALFGDWPECDAIVGNPPILGDRKIRGGLGKDYLKRIQDSLGVPGVVNLSCYWFRRAHDRLAQGARAGLIGTSGMRVGKAREASLDYIANNGGTITDAVSSRLWPGDAALDVSMVNWIKGSYSGQCHLTVDDQILSVPTIHTHLQLHADVSDAKVIAANSKRLSMRGVTFGHDAFVLHNSSPLVSQRHRVRVIRPVAASRRMLLGTITSKPEHCIHLGAYDTEASARAAASDAVDYLKEEVYPSIRKQADDDNKTGGHYRAWVQRWWQPLYFREDFFAALPAHVKRLIVCPHVLERPTFEFISTGFVPTDTMQMFAFADDYSFGIIQSVHHWRWAKAHGGKTRKQTQYTADVWKTFPWPQMPRLDAAVRVADAARALRARRRALIEANGWSLQALYQAAEVPGSHPLKDAQAALDEAVSKAYGMPAGGDALAFLLELNQCVAEDEEQGRNVTGPGLPPGLDGDDPRWMSDDCVEPLP
jgi:SAM-dependent methyltransferase